MTSLGLNVAGARHLTRGERIECQDKPAGGQSNFCSRFWIKDARRTCDSAGWHLKSKGADLAANERKKGRAIVIVKFEGY